MQEREIDETEIKEMLALAKEGNLAQLTFMMENYSSKDKKKILAKLNVLKNNDINNQGLADKVGLQHEYQKDKQAEGSSERPLVTFEDLEEYPYAEVIADMLVSFGDNGGSSGLQCWCSSKRNCNCLEPILWMHEYAREYGAELLEHAIKRGKSKTISLELLHKLKPLEMQEYTRWARAKKSGKCSEIPEEMDEGELEGMNDSESDAETDTEAVDTAPPVAGKRKRDDFSVVDAVNVVDVVNVIKDASETEEAFRKRMGMRKSFADARTEAMSSETYTEVFAAQRNAFFIWKQARGTKVGSIEHFFDWLGVRLRIPPRNVAKAFGYLIYDRIGLVVEDAIKARTGGTLQETQSNNRLITEELEAAAQRLPSISSELSCMPIYHTNKKVSDVKGSLVHEGGGSFDRPVNVNTGGGEINNNPEESGVSVEQPRVDMGLRLFESYKFGP